MDQPEPERTAPRPNAVEQFRPVRPVRAEREDDLSSPGTKRAKSSFSIILAGGAALFAIAIFAVLMAPVAGVVFGVIGLVLCLAGLAAFHYVVWGWWLGGVIRSEVEADEKADSETGQRIQQPGGRPENSGPPAAETDR